MVRCLALARYATSSALRVSDDLMRTDANDKPIPTGHCRVRPRCRDRRTRTVSAFPTVASLRARTTASHPASRATSTHLRVSLCPRTAVQTALPGCPITPAQGCAAPQRDRAHIWLYRSVDRGGHQPACSLGVVTRTKDPRSLRHVEMWTCRWTLFRCSAQMSIAMVMDAVGIRAGLRASSPSRERGVQ
jgi:hypothetical protein